MSPADSTVDRAIAALLDDDASLHDPVPPWEVIEHVLTAGYAEVLELEAERVHLQHKLRGAMTDDSEPRAPEEVGAITDVLGELELRVARLRSRLAELDARYRAPLWSATEGLSPLPETA
jgi:hypothetical protein